MQIKCCNNTVAIQGCPDEKVEQFRLTHLITTLPTAEPPGPASGAFRSVEHPHPAVIYKLGEYASGALGRETPRPQDLSAPRYGTMVNKVGLNRFSRVSRTARPSWQKCPYRNPGRGVGRVIELALGAGKKTQAFLSPRREDAKGNVGDVKVKNWLPRRRGGAEESFGRWKSKSKSKACSRGGTEARRERLVFSFQQARQVRGAERRFRC